MGELMNNNRATLVTLITAALLGSLTPTPQASSTRVNTEPVETGELTTVSPNISHKLATGARTFTDPWRHLVHTGPPPLYNNPLNCLRPWETATGFNFGLDYCDNDADISGTHPLDCGDNATMVNLDGSVSCASNQVGITQLDGTLTQEDRDQARAYLMARGLSASAADYAVNALNALNLHSFTCSQNTLTNHASMQDLGEIVMNLQLFSYAFGVTGMSQISAPKPSFCNKHFQG